MIEYFRYLPVSLRDQQWGLYVTAAGLQPVPPTAHYPSKGHSPTHGFVWQRGCVLDHYGAIYLVRGKGEFESKLTGPRDLAEGDLLLVFPKVWHRYRPVSGTDWEAYWVHFAGKNVERLQHHKFITPEDPVLKIGLDDVVLHPFVRLLDRLRAEPVGFQRMIAADTMEILAAALGAAQAHLTGSLVHDQIRRARALLGEDIEDVPSMEDIAAELDLSRVHFFRLFKEHTGLSPYQYHLELKLSRARWLLRNSDLPVKQIAQTLGFRNVYHFSKLFKSKIGAAPTPWRQQGIPEIPVEQAVNHRKKRRPACGSERAAKE